MIASTGLYPKHLDRDIDKIHNDAYAKYATQYTNVAKIGNFPKGNHLTEARISGLGAHRQIGEGQAVDFDTPTEGREKTLYPIKFGLGFQITEEMIEDAVHPNVYQMAKSLARSANHTLELYFWDLFNSGDDTHESDDGEYIFADHTTMRSGDSLDNKGSSALSETTFQAMYEYFDTLLDDAGYPVFTTLKYLLVPTKERWMALRLAKQKGGITPWDGDEGNVEWPGDIDGGGTGWNVSGNLMSSNPSNGMVSGWKPMVVRYLDSALGGDDDSWFAVSEDHDMRLLWKKKIQLYTGEDLQTGNKIYISKMRFNVGAFDYKGVYGSFVS